MGDLAIGYQPTAQLLPQDEALFRAFQSNLLSLISHELRTPLMGILNSLSLLDEKDESGAPPLPVEELVKMARQNANRLNRTLVALLDLAQLESGVFHARLREIDFAKTIRNRLDSVAKEIAELGLQTKLSAPKAVPILADPQKIVRAVDLCLQAILPRAQAGSGIEVSVGDAEVRLSFKIKPELREAWEQARLQAQAGFQGGVASPSSAFAGVMQSEQAFLSRQEEGLGSEFLLIHEIMRLHRGRFKDEQEGEAISLVLQFSGVSSEDDVRAILTSRAYDVSTELATVALILMDVPASSSVRTFTELLKSHLFRSSDAVYPLTEANRVALVLDDCKAEDIEGLLARIKRSLPKDKIPKRVGWAHCPGDELDPGKLFDLAASRVKK